MKKLTALLLTFVLLLSFAACASKDTEETATEEPTESVQPDTQSESDVATLPDVSKKKPIVDADPEEEQQKTKTTVASMEVAEGETLVCDSDALGLKITGYEEESDGGYKLSLVAANKTDRTSSLSIDDVVVNGWLCDPGFLEELDPGETKACEMEWYAEQLQECGIETVTQIAFGFELYDADDYSLDAYDTGRFTYAPLGEDAVQIQEREPGENDKVLFENDQCAMIITSIDPEGSWGYTLNVYLINKTDYELMFAVDDAHVNGIELDPFWAWSVPPQARSTTDISWYEDDLTDAGITDITEIELEMDVYNNDDWSEADILEETYVIQP